MSQHITVCVILSVKCLGYFSLGIIHKKCFFFSEAGDEDINRQQFPLLPRGMSNFNIISKMQFITTFVANSCSDFSD